MGLGPHVDGQVGDFTISFLVSRALHNCKIACVTIFASGQATWAPPPPVAQLPLLITLRIAFVSPEGECSNLENSPPPSVFPLRFRMENPTKSRKNSASARILPPEAVFVLKDPLRMPQQILKESLRGSLLFMEPFRNP